MSSLFFDTNEFSVIPELHHQYAEKVVQIFINRILQLDSIDIGVRHGNDTVVSIITLVDDSFEKVVVNLIFANNFRLEVFDNSGGELTSEFSYNIQNESVLEEMIPEGLRNLMDEVLDNEEPMEIQTRTLK